MTGELYIYKRKPNYIVSKKINEKTHTFGFFKTMEEAIFARGLLIDNDWDINKIKMLGPVLEFENRFLVVSIFKDQMRFLEVFDDYDTAVEKSDEIIKNFEENPHRSRYGTYIYENNGLFYIRKMIDKRDVWFGMYRALDDATFARDLLKDHDWDLNEIAELPKVHFSEIHGKYLIVGVADGRLIIAGSFDDEDDAIENAEKSLEEYKKSKYRTGERYVVFNGKMYAVQRGVSGKIIYYGSFHELEDAVAVRDLLVSIDWNLEDVYENRIYEFSDIFYKFHIFENLVKIIGKFKSHDDAVGNVNNLSSLTYEDIYDPENQYSKANRHITKRLGEYWVKKKIDGQIRMFGPYPTRDAAIDARDEYEKNGWDFGLDGESIYSNGGDYDDSLEDIVSDMSLWQKIIYDTIVRLEKTYFSFDDLLNHSYLKRYRSGNFETKVSKHLGELVAMGLVSQLEENIFRKEF